jgi:uncharacterized Zn finger protein
MSNRSSSFLGFALVAAFLGGVSAAVLSHPKGHTIKEHLKEVGDDLADALDRAIDTVQDKGAKNSDPIDISDVVLAVFNELKDMNSVAKDHVVKRPLLEQLREKAVEDVRAVENSLEDLPQTIEWFEKQGKSLAKRSLKRF